MLRLRLFAVLSGLCKFLNLEVLSLPASIFLLLLLGIWIYLHRQVDFWLLMGMTAVFARLWSYHRWYDDLLIILPMLTLFNIAKKPHITDAKKLCSALLLAITIIIMIAPGGQYLLPFPMNKIYIGLQGIVWITVIYFFHKLSQFEMSKIK